VGTKNAFAVILVSEKAQRRMPSRSLHLIERNVDVLKTFGFDRAVVGKFMVWGLMALVAGATNSACSRSPLEGGEGESDLAQVVLALDAAPADVGCVVITANTDHADRRAFSVTPGAATTFSLPRLPVGLVVFSVDAFAGACAGVGSTSVATWLGGPVSAVLHAGANAPIAIAMRRNGEVKVSVDFGAGGAAPVCAAEGAACVANADCCTNRCVVDPAQASGVGVCQMAAPPPPPPGPSFTFAFEAAKNYLFFPVDGAPGCGNDATLSVTVSGTEEICIPASLGDVIPVPVGPVSVCSTATGCEPCTSDSCRPQSCFAAAPTAPAGGVCAFKLKVGPGEEFTTYLLLRRIDVANPPPRPEGFPRVVGLSSHNADVTITPPDDQPIAVARLGTPLAKGSENPGGEMCGGFSLCGIVPYQAFGGSLFGNWFFNAGPNGSLFSSPLF
jgi:hypothetical protein